MKDKGLSGFLNCEYDLHLTIKLTAENEDLNWKGIE